MNQSPGEEERINPGHSKVRDVLRTSGPIVIGIGAVLMLIGLGSFFSSFGSFEPPKYFWCCFLGMPCMMAGLVMTKFGYMGAISRYVAGEAAPVGKDTFNYMAEGTKPGVQAIAGAIADGLSGPAIANECGSCHYPNDADAKFCQECGSGLKKACGEIDCKACGAPSAASAKFCDHCGSQL